MRSFLLPALLALAAAAQLSCFQGGAAREGWNVLLVTFDTTRADHLSCYGNESVETPNLDRLAEEGVLFAHAYSSVPITAPSHSTILTGLHPTGHGVRDNGMFHLGEESVTLAEILRDAGYATAAAVGSFPLASGFGLAQGFDLYDDHFSQPYEDFRGERAVRKTRMFFDERKAELVNEPLLEWLDDHSRDPFFVWAHYFDPHLPVEPPPPYDQLYLADPYLGEIAYADEALGQLLAKLEELKVAERTIVVVTADHGEGRGEHNETTHSTLAYNSTLHVPLLLRVPELAAGLRVEPRVGLIDIAPTLLDLLGLEPPSPVDGRSMVPLIAADGQPTKDFPRPQYAETLSPRISHDLGELRVLYDRGYKYIFGPRPELYEVTEDPHEVADLIDARPEVAEAMQGKLARHLEGLGKAGAVRVEIDEETRRRLEALGYISSGTSASAIVEELDPRGTPPQDRVADVNEVSTAKNELLNGRPLSALALTQTLLRRDPDNVFYLQLKATAELQLGRLEESLLTAEEIARRNPQGLPKQELVLRLVESLYYDGQIERALALLREQQELAPTPLGHWYLASLHDSLGDIDGRRAALEEALRLDETFAPARTDLAIIRAGLGDLPTAEQELERAIRDRPYYAKAHFNYGVVLLQLGRPEAALKPLRRATVLEPGYLRAHHAVTMTALVLGALPTAEHHLDALRRTAPDHPLTLEAAERFSAPPPGS